MSDLPSIGDEIAGCAGARTKTQICVLIAPMPPDLVPAALAYAARGWPVFPVGQHKRPLTANGRSDATTDAATIRRWFSRPNVLIAVATGSAAGIVALDIDAVSESVCGFDSLELLGVSLHLATPTAHTPRGGCHLLFKHPGYFVKTIAGKLGRALDIRGDGGSITLPPGPGRYWDPHLGPDTPLAPMPEWMKIIPEPESKPSAGPAPTRTFRLTRYSEAALDGAVKAIISAPAGQQHDILNRESFALGGLVAAGVLPTTLALESLTWAARQMPSYDRRRHWRPAELERQVRNSFLDGQLHPRQVPA